MVGISVAKGRCRVVGVVAVGVVHQLAVPVLRYRVFHAVVTPKHTWQVGRSILVHPSQSVGVVRKPLDVGAEVATRWLWPLFCRTSSASCPSYLKGVVGVIAGATDAIPTLGLPYGVGGVVRFWEVAK